MTYSTTASTVATSTSMQPPFTVNNVGTITAISTTATIASTFSGISIGGGGGGYCQVTVSGKNPKIVTDKGEIDLDQLLDIVKRAEAILCVVKADMERLDRYPALQEAYDHYRIIDALCRGDEDDG